MNLDQLPYIIAIAASGNLSAASRQLGVSQPALSKYLRELEQKAGIKLFFRRQRQYLPTPAGRAYIQAANRILELHRHMKVSIAALDPAHLGRLRIGTSPTRGIAALAEAYPDLDLRYPQIELDIREGYGHQLQELLCAGQLDCVITTHIGPPDSRLQALPIFSEELVLAVPAFFPGADHGCFTLDELPFADLHQFQDHIFILPGPDLPLSALIRDMFLRADFQPKITTSAPNISIPETMIRSGTRVGILPAHFVRSDPEIAFFRLRNSPMLTVSYLSAAGPVYSPPERYLIYLLLRHELRAGSRILWNELFRELVWEFDPVAAADLNLEASNGH